jgi:hypothetical protein
MRPVNSSQVALGGLNSQLERFERAASGIAQLTTDNETVGSVDVSPAAKRTAEPDRSLPAGLEGKIIDVRIAKYLAIANMNLIETEDAMAGELLAAVSDRR